MLMFLQMLPLIHKNGSQHLNQGKEVGARAPLHAIEKQVLLPQSAHVGMWAQGEHQVTESPNC
jgi:hypothetical protein